jgi:shikimate kinase
MDILKHIALVGLAAVGKTTLGRMVARELALPFADVDFLMENMIGKSLDEILKESGDAKLNGLLWAAYCEILRRQDPLIIAVSPRLLSHHSFWTLTKSHAISIHIRSTPLKLLRRELAVKQNKKEFEIILTENMKREYYWYYWWRLNHCRKADHEVRLTGNPNEDAEILISTIQQNYARNRHSADIES